MRDDYDSDRREPGSRDFPIVVLVLLAAMFFMIAGANVYMQDNRPDANISDGRVLR